MNHSKSTLHPTNCLCCGTSMHALVIKNVPSQQSATRLPGRINFWIMFYINSMFYLLLIMQYPRTRCTGASTKSWQFQRLTWNISPPIRPSWMFQFYVTGCVKAHSSMQNIERQALAPKVSCLFHWVLVSQVHQSYVLLIVIVLTTIEQWHLLHSKHLDFINALLNFFRASAKTPPLETKVYKETKNVSMPSIR